MRKQFLILFSFTFLFFFSSCFASDEAYILNGRISKSDKRYESFLLALKLLNERQAKTVVETGTARYGDQGFVGDGGSTIIFGDWAHQNQAKLYSIDNDPAAIEKAKGVTKEYASQIDFPCSNSVKYLKKFGKPIDFIYLDSYEYDCQNPLPCQEHHLKEIIAAYPFLHKNSVVMVDDCELPGQGLGKLVIEFLVDNGWKFNHRGHQTILTQD